MSIRCVFPYDVTIYNSYFIGVHSLCFPYDVTIYNSISYMSIRCVFLYDVTMGYKSTFHISPFVVFSIWRHHL